MELLRYVIFLYCFLGVFIAGGLFFKNRSPANISVSLFILLFVFELLDYLYTTTDVLFLFPEYHLWVYPLCLLFGPALWLHFYYVKNGSTKFKMLHLLHGVPFLLFVLIFMSPLYAMEGVQRISFSNENFMTHMMPLNYIRTTHVVLYGIVMVFVLIKERLFQHTVKGAYLSIIAIIYLITALLQLYLTAFADSYRQFSIYYFLAATIIIIAGFVQYHFPDMLQELQQKYFGSTLKKEDSNRISKKIVASQSFNEHFSNSDLQLAVFCKEIGERSHHVSQVFSEEFHSSFSNFVNEKRIAKAKAMLEDPSKDDLKILAVAFECGFNNHVTFNKAFVKYTGLTPGKYRKGRNN